MKARAVLAALVVLACGLALAPRGGAVAQLAGMNIASESYYTIDVPNGTATARVEAVVQNATSTELTEVILWAMPRAQDLVVKQGDTVLEIETEAISDEVGLPTLVAATLPRALRPNARTNLVMTYTVPAQSTELVKMEPGAVEAMFVSQGPGSFVLIDLPQDGDNYLEPGCLRVISQPEAVRAAGLERHVCGESLLIAISLDDRSLIEKCARLDNSCRQRTMVSPFVGFAQSITDTARQGRLVEEIAIGDGSTTLTLLYFAADRAWAQEQFAVAKAALPRLEAVFGFPYPHDQVILRQSSLLSLAGFAGLAFTRDGEMLITKHPPEWLAQGFNEAEVTVHELAHQWAGLNLETSWLWEGLAEYGMRTVAPELGITPYNRGWEEFGYTDLLGNWYNGSGVYNPDYWYGKAGAFWFAYQEAIGGQAKMREVLSLMDDARASWPLDGRWFMDRGEEVSGANLDTLFTTWVWREDTATPLLAERRAARALMVELHDRAREHGLVGVPTDIWANLESWEFRPIAQQVARANAVIDGYLAVAAAAAAAGVPVGDGLVTRWGSSTVPQLTALVEEMRQALDAITAAETRVAAQPSGAPGNRALADAREAFSEGDYGAAKQLAANATTTLFNQEAATALLQVAREMKAAFRPSFLEKVGLLMEDPDADLAAAEAAYAAGDFDTVLRKSRAAMDTWNGASSAGLFRLATLAALMSLLVAGGWLLVRRLDRGKQPENSFSGAPREGHILPEATTREGSWRDWLNEKD